MGTVFSVEEFSVFDGPGARMSIFLKGCPLRCEWCHNPEGQSFEPVYIKGDNGCLGCGACLKAGLSETGEAKLCQKSVAVCPKHLVRLCGKEYAAQELTETVLKNASVLSAMGGGVTFSGGEPLAQSEFLLDCLVRLEGKVHRAVQTCGMVEPEVFSAVLAHCDYVLYDIKLMNDSLHRRYTGVGNEKILSNYRMLVQSGIPFITRIPLIPGVSDTVENITETAVFLHSLGVTKAELLPYNKLAGSKYHAVGRDYHPSFEESTPPNSRDEIWNQYGIEVTVL